MKHGHVFIILVSGIKGGGAKLALILEAVRKVDVLHVVLHVRLLAKLFAANGAPILGPAVAVQPFNVGLKHASRLTLPRQSCNNKSRQP